MDVTVQIVGSVVDHLPGFDGDGMAHISVSDQATVDDVMQRLDIYSLGGIAVLVNGQPVAPAARLTAVLATGDAVVILPPIEGG